MSNYPIDTKVIVKESVANSISISYVIVDLTKNASYTAYLKDASGETISSQNITLTPEEYAQWGTDDSYIIQLTCQRLGVVVKPEIS